MPPLSAILCVTCALSALCIAQYYGAKYWNTLCRLSALCHSISIWSIEKCSIVTVLHSVMYFLVLIVDLVAVLYPVPQTSRMYLVCYCIPNSVPFRTDTGKGRSRQGCTFWGPDPLIQNCFSNDKHNAKYKGKFMTHFEAQIRQNWIAFGMTNTMTRIFLKLDLFCNWETNNCDCFLSQIKRNCKQTKYCGHGVS